MRTPRPVTPTRRWAAIALATAVVTISFWAMAYGLAVAAAGTPADPARDTTMIAAAGVSLAVALMPVAFGLAAFTSRRPDWPIAVLAAMGLALCVGLPLLWFGNPLASLVAGYAAGAVVSVSLPEGVTWHARAVGAAGVAVLVVGGMATAFAVAALVAPGLPFTAVGAADRLSPRLASAPTGADRS